MRGKGSRLTVRMSLLSFSSRSLLRNSLSCSGRVREREVSGKKCEEERRGGGEEEREGGVTCSALRINMASLSVWISAEAAARSP